MAKAFGIVTSSAEQKVAGVQQRRSIGAFSFLGRYRIIDFAISNFSNSDIDNIQVYISSKPHSLIAHVGTGRHYNINSKRGNIDILFPDEENLNEIYNTNINSFIENLERIKSKPFEYVVIQPSCMVFSQDFDALLKQHIASGADITTLYHKVDDAHDGYNTCNVLHLDGEKVTAITPCLGDNATEDIFMETFIMKKDLLLDLIEAARQTSSMYTLSDIVSAKCDTYDVRGVAHEGFFAPITSLATYFKANLDLLDMDKANALFHEDWPIYTRTTDSCPARYFAGAMTKKSFIANGCLIKGSVENAVIGRGVTIEEGAVVKNCVIMAHSKIRKDAVVENQVIDKYATITAGRKIIADFDKPGYIHNGDII